MANLLSQPKHNHRQHDGELLVQQKRGAPEGVSDALFRFIKDDMPEQHSTFFENLSYFAIATTDKFGRPWTTLVTGNATKVVRAASSSLLQVQTRLPRDDPVGNCFADGDGVEQVTWAGLGVDFTNRRRNKVAGIVEKGFFDGNTNTFCCQYITLRTLIPFERQAETILNDVGEDEKIFFSEAERALINRASTRSTTDMGLNHRGGSPGFVRVLDENGTSSLILPDYSGNRFYQSLGNVQSDKLAGMILICFQTGDLLYITGKAENLFDQDAEKLMPRQSLITRIVPTGRVYVKNGLNLKLTSEEQYSPYNPPIRYLRTELAASGKTISDENNTATLREIRKLTANVSTFVFELDKPVQYLPGAFAIFDFSSVFERQYSHMNFAKPKQVNDDYVRTWTISDSPSPSMSNDGTFQPTRFISCTIKHVQGGTMSTFLHQLNSDAYGRLRVRLSGIGEKRSASSQKLLFIAAGVGITPFLAMAAGFKAYPTTSDIRLLFSARGDEVNLAKEFEDSNSMRQITVFDSRAGLEIAPLAKNTTLQNRRISEEDIKNVDSLTERKVFLCGPVEFMNLAVAWLIANGVKSENIHRDSFNF
ncbi:hypothetical protein BDR26DRAFT_880683 [Obelidium mucronatum]|nr:hypothetical protein BDR26DRAFT_880683 [Obelidium mucronatum]